MPPTNTYNLDIHMYSFEELLNLFNLSYDMDIHDMKRAKKQVLCFPSQQVILVTYWQDTMHRRCVLQWNRVNLPLKN